MTAIKNKIMETAAIGPEKITTKMLCASPWEKPFSPSLFAAAI